VKIGFKFQSLGKISSISTSDSGPRYFRSIPTLVHTDAHTRYGRGLVIFLSDFSAAIA